MNLHIYPIFIYIDSYIYSYIYMNLHIYESIHIYVCMYREREGRDLVVEELPAQPPCLTILKSPWHRHPGALKINGKCCPCLSKVTKYKHLWGFLWATEMGLRGLHLYLSLYCIAFSSDRSPYRCCFMLQVVQLVNLKKAFEIGIF